MTPNWFQSCSSSITAPVCVNITCFNHRYPALTRHYITSSTSKSHPLQNDMKLQPTTLISVIASLLASIPVSGGSSIGIKRTLYNDTSDANHLQHAKRKLLSGKYLQLVDHTNTKLGSFPQHFWIDRQYYNAKMGALYVTSTSESLTWFAFVDSPVFLFLVEDHDPG